MVPKKKCDKHIKLKMPAGFSNFIGMDEQQFVQRFAYVAPVPPVFAEAVASYPSDEESARGVIFPGLSEIREVSAQVALATIKQALAEDLVAERCRREEGGLLRRRTGDVHATPCTKPRSTERWGSAVRIVSASRTRGDSRELMCLMRAVPSSSSVMRRW